MKPASATWTFLALLAVLLFGSENLARAAVWTEVPSGTTSDLWGISSGGTTIITIGGGVSGTRGYVAVGTGGTIIYAGESGNAWATEISGTSVWLLAVTYGGNQWVVVGDQGTILTSADAIHWTPQSSGTTQRLNGVATGLDGNNQPIYVAVGEGGTVCASSDGIHWALRNSGVSTWLRGIRAYSTGNQHGFIISGQAGVILKTTDESSFVAVPTGSSQDLEAVGMHPATSSVAPYFTVAGAGGTVGTLIFDPTGTTLQWSASVAGSASAHYRGIDQDVAVGQSGVGAVEIGSTSSFSPFTLPQSNDLNAFADDDLPPVAVGQGGIIWSLSRPTSSQAAGNVTASSGLAVVGQQETLQAPVVTAATYQWYLNGSMIPGATGATLTLTNLQNSGAGTYTVAVGSNSWVLEYTYGLSVYALPAYSPNLVDQSFQNRGGSGSVLPQPDGKFLLYGGTYVVNGHSQFGVCRLNSDGSVDSSFDAGVGLVVAPYSLVPSRAVLQPDGKAVLTGMIADTNGIQHGAAVRINPDGSLDQNFLIDSPLLSSPACSVVLRSDGTFWFLSATGGVLEWRRLTISGALDPTFNTSTAQTNLAIATNISGTITNAFGFLDAAGGCWVVVTGSSLAAPDYTSGSQLFHLTPDGSIDPAFNQGRTFTTFAIQQLMNVGNQMLYYGAGSVTGLASYGIVGRFSVDGTNDPSWPQRMVSGLFTVPAVVALETDGSVVIVQPIYLDGLSPDGYAVERVTAQNQIDTNCGGVISGQVIQSLLPLSGGQLLAVGNFTQLNGFSSPSVSRLNLDETYPLTRLVNLSILGQTGPQPLDLGFVIGGSGSKQVLVRAAGPALSEFSVPNPVPDPQLSVYLNSAVVAMDDNWGDAGAAASVSAVALRVGAFPFPVGSKDAALVLNLGASDYSALDSATVSGATLAEVYDADAASANYSAARVLNFSVLTQIAVSGQSVTTGFVVGGPSARRFVIRADGPALSAFGVANVLADPSLALFGARGLIASNTGWGNAPGYDTTVAQQVGAFTLQAESKDSGMVVALPAGSYTAQVTSASGGTGAVEIEVFEVP